MKRPAPANPMCCRGTDLQLPFQCPLDFMLPIPALERQAVQYRSAGFLQLPQARGGRLCRQGCAGHGGMATAARQHQGQPALNP